MKKNKQTKRKIVLLDDDDDDKEEEEQVKEVNYMSSDNEEIKSSENKKKKKKEKSDNKNDNKKDNSFVFTLSNEFESIKQKPLINLDELKDSKIVLIEIPSSFKLKDVKEHLTKIDINNDLQIIDKESGLSLSKEQNHINVTPLFTNSEDDDKLKPILKIDSYFKVKQEIKVPKIDSKKLLKEELTQKEEFIKQRDEFSKQIAQTVFLPFGFDGEKKKKDDEKVEKEEVKKIKQKENKKDEKKKKKNTEKEDKKRKK